MVIPTTNPKLELISRTDPNLYSNSVGGALSQNGISEDGRYLVFTSSADNVVPGDSNHAEDVFLLDRTTGTTTLVSRNSSGGSGGGSNPVISSDGRFVAFSSAASLISEDNNNTTDVFVFDRITGAVTLVSRNGTGSSGNGISGSPTISGDGGFVTFSSAASDLVAGDGNNADDVFLWDRSTGATTLVSHKSSGVGSGNSRSFNPVISQNGNSIVFTSDASDLIPESLSFQDNNHQTDVFLWERSTGTVTLLSRNWGGVGSGNGSSAAPTISRDGSLVAFSSSASDLVPGDNNNTQDAFVWERTTGSLTLLPNQNPLLSFGNYGSSRPIVSRDGQFVVYQSYVRSLTEQRNIYDVWLWPRNLGGSPYLLSRDITFLELGSTVGFFESPDPVISGDGRFVAFVSHASDLTAGDNNSSRDVFLFDRTTGTKTLVSRNSMGTGTGNTYSYLPIISDDGSVIGFTSDAFNLVAKDINGQQDIFAFDRQTGSNSLISRRDPNLPPLTPNRSSLGGLVSGDGRYVAFTSDASNLMPNDSNGNISDVFLFDRSTKTMTLVSHNQDGTGSGNQSSALSAMTRDGRFVVFTSRAFNLVVNDNNVNATEDVFVWDRFTGETTLVSRSPDSTGSGNGDSSGASISSDGRFVTFLSDASNLVTGDNNNARDVFLFDRNTGVTTLVSRNSSGTDSGNASTFEARISQNGNFVVFSSNASDLVSGDSNGNKSDIFLWDRNTSVTTLVSHNSTGTGTPNGYSTDFTLSQDNQFVAFTSDAPDVAPGDNNEAPDVFLWDRNTGTTTLVSHNLENTGGGNNRPSYVGSMSNDSRFVLFESSASNLVAGDNNDVFDIFLWDRTTGAITLVSRNQNGTGTGNHQAFNASLSEDGNWVTFTSDASDLVPGDNNGTTDVFLWNRLTGATTLISRRPDGTSGDRQSFSSVISGDGSFILFGTDATNLTAGDYNNTADILGFQNFSAPTAVNLSNLTAVLPENTTTTTRIKVADITVVDDGLGTNLLSLSGPDASFFEIANDVLYLKAGTVLNARAKSKYAVAVDVDDSLLGTAPDATTQFSLNISPIAPNLLQPIANDGFSVTGGSGNAQVFLTLTQQNTPFVNEIGVFRVDDDQGRINGIAPNAPGYRQAALSRAQVVFSTLPSFPQLITDRTLNVTGGDRLHFFLVQNSTIDALLAGQPGTVLFSDPIANLSQFDPLQVSPSGQNTFTLRFQDQNGTAPNSDAVVMTVQLRSSSPVPGSNLQGQPQSELLDLRGQNGQLSVTFELYREAAYNNTVGFYAIENQQGQVRDELGTLLNPGDAGYAKAALQRRVPNGELQTPNGSTTGTTLQLDGGVLLAPYIIVDSNPNGWFNSQAGKTPDVFFPFLGANSDRVDHVRLLGDNTWGFEDLVNGGDRDYNDLIIRATFNRGA